MGEAQNDIAIVSLISFDSQALQFQLAARQIGLSRPNKNDSFVLRLWTSSMIIPHQMIELRIKGDKWYSKKYDYYFDLDGRLFFKNIPIKHNNEVHPLINSLQSINFLDFVSQEDIAGFEDNVADGMTYNLEIFWSSSYKKVMYHCPENYYSKDANNKRFVDLLMLLDGYFGFYAPICSKK